MVSSLPSPLTRRDRDNAAVVEQEVENGAAPEPNRVLLLESNGTKDSNTAVEEETWRGMSLRKSSRSLLTETSALSFSNINVYAGKGNKRKHIINGVSGTVKSGRVLAIMGPSGAGKSVLIRAMTLDALGMFVTGSVRIGSTVMTKNTFTSCCCIVKQHDKHWPYITARETLMFAAKLYDIAHEKKDIGILVDEVLVKTGMETCKDTRCNKLSGGQNRRLSIALALLKQPSVLFFDEPTSGLDAAAASNIMLEINQLARRANLIIVCTIHQPSTKVYEGFDQVMILSKGREAFAGDVSDTEEYFASIGHPLPKNMNPAEHYLDLVNADFSDDTAVDKVLDAWDDFKAERRLREDTAGEAKGEQKPKANFEVEDGEHTARMSEMRIMFLRSILFIIRDPVMYIGRALVFFASSLVFGIFYWNARTFTQDQLMNKTWVTVWFIVPQTNMGVVAVMGLNDEFKSLKTEIKNGMVSPVTYLLAKSLLVLPVMVIFAVVSIGVSAFAIQDWMPSCFFTTVSLTATYFFVFECAAEAFSVWFNDAIMGMLAFIGFWFFAWLGSGILIPKEDMFWPFTLFYYMSPLGYALRGLMYSQFIDAEFEPCYADPTSAVCVPSGDGASVLDGLGVVFPVISSDNTLPADFGIMLAIAFVFKIIYVAGVIFKSHKVSLIKDLGSAAAASD